MCIICTYTTSCLSSLAQGADLTDIARLGPKVSEALPLRFGDLDGYGALFARLSDLLGALDLSPTSVTSTFIGVSSARCSC